MSFDISTGSAQVLELASSSQKKYRNLNTEFYCLLQIPSSLAKLNHFEEIPCFMNMQIMLRYGVEIHRCSHLTTACD